MDVRGISQLKSKVKQLETQMSQGVGDAVRTTITSIEKDAKKNLTSNRSVLTGNLRRSIFAEMTSKHEGVTYTPVEYAHYLEFGTSRQSPKPFFFPAVYKGQKDFVKKMNELGSKLK